jgi:hypothetical protein
MTGDLLLQNNRTALVQPDQMERVLADVDSDRVDGVRCILIPPPQRLESRVFHEISGGNCWLFFLPEVWFACAI